ncbi:hypothetical protein EMCRGX_G010122 [Ephydatia muelleri]|eukprot:Em0003g1428a
MTPPYTRQEGDEVYLVCYRMAAGIRDSAQATLQRLLTTCGEFVEKYQQLTVRDPELTYKLETGLRVVSYLFPGRLGASQGVFELAYCVSNLFSLLNDYIVCKKCPAASNMTKLTRGHQRLLWCLAILETIEVVFEVFMEQLMSEPGKYGAVILVQCIKACLRLVHVFLLKGGIVKTPAVSGVDRSKAQPLCTTTQVDSDFTDEGKPVAWKGTRTGKVIRSIHADSSISYSQLQNYVTQSGASSRDGRPGSPQRPTTLNSSQTVAEVLYIARPLVHVVSMFVFKQTSWKPWLIALIMDLVSLQCHGTLSKFNAPERAEVLRRRSILLVYLLRSPFYDEYTKDILMRFLKYLSATIPLAHYIIDPLVAYLPVWQHIYSYNWMT